MRLRVAPSRDQKVNTSLPFPVRTTEVALKQFIANCLIQWTNSLTSKAAASVQIIIADITRDENAADKRAKSHRWCRLCHIPNHQVTIVFEDYTEPA